jgi:hypothetical protein
MLNVKSSEIMTGYHEALADTAQTDQWVGGWPARLSRMKSASF